MTVLKKRYFQDEDVLNNVPNLFLLLGGIFAGLEIIGLLLLQVRSKSELEQCEKFVLLPILSSFKEGFTQFTDNCIFSLNILNLG